MSKRAKKSFISRDEMLAKLEKWPRLKLVSSDDIAFLFDLTEDGLKKMRDAGRGPRFHKDATAEASGVKYPAGEVLKYLEDNLFSSTREYAAANQAWKEKNDLARAKGDPRPALSTFSAFVQEAHADHEWPFLVKGKQVSDFFEAVDQDDTSTGRRVWLTLQEYLSGRMADATEKMLKAQKKAPSADTAAGPQKPNKGRI